MSLASALQLVFGTQVRFAPPAAPTLPAGLKIRELLPGDRDSCLQIFRHNEAGKFPAGVVPDFELFLTRQDYLKLVCCVDEKITAVGGIGLTHGLRSLRAWLVFGMVDAPFHGRGIGTALLMSRLAALPKPIRPVRLLLSNVPGSVGFFARFGFQLQGQMPARPSGQLIDVCAAMLDVEAWEICRNIASQHLAELTSLKVPHIDMDPRSPNNRWRGP